MPTADAFDEAARSFDRAAQELAELMHTSPSHLGPDTLRGGLLTLVADLTVATAHQTATATASVLHDLAFECRHRADVCRTFAADLALYNRRLARFEGELAAFDPTDPTATVPVRPARPRRPASYVEL